MMYKKVILTLVALLLLTGCYNEEDTKANIVNEVDEFFELMILEDIDAVMNKFVKGTEDYYDFFTQTLATFRDNSLNYSIEELSFVTLTKDQQVVKVLVNVNGVDIEKNNVDYSALYTFTYTPVSKSEHKIEFIDIQYNIN